MPMATMPHSLLVSLMITIQPRQPATAASTQYCNAPRKCAGDMLPSRSRCTSPRHPTQAARLLICQYSLLIGRRQKAQARHGAAWSSNSARSNDSALPVVVGSTSDMLGWFPPEDSSLHDWVNRRCALLPRCVVSPRGDALASG